MNEPMTGEAESVEQALGKGQEAPLPLLRVYLFGEFQLAWQVLSDMEEAAWDSRTSARTLFKLLLCAPGRQATKSVLAGILWPETDEEKARESLRSACKVLRKVLRTANGEELLEQRNNGEILKLAGQRLLWVDADAFDDLVAQASRTAVPEKALALWQQAKAVLRGELLADDQDAEWAGHRWVKQRRQALWMGRCRMIRHLADLYIQHGQISLAEETLEQHIVRFPTDQDALYRLLVLLEQQHCFEQARMLYERTRRTLEAVGKQPASHVRAYYEHLRKVAFSREWLANSLPQLRLSAMPHLSERTNEQLAGDRLEPAPFTTAYTSNTLLPSAGELPSLSIIVEQGTTTMEEAAETTVFFPLTGELSSKDMPVASSVLFKIGVELLSFVQHQQSWPLSELLSHLEAVLGRSNGMSPMKLSRRQALELFVGLPAGLLGVMELGKHIAAEEVLLLCTTSLPACWNLFWLGGLPEVERALPAYFSQLLPLAQQSSLYGGNAARLASQMHQIASLLVLEREDFGTSLAHCKQAFLYGQRAGDRNLQVAALIRQANTLFYRKRYAQILQTYQEALQFIDEVSPLLRGRVYSGLGSAQATIGQKQEALRSLGLAHETFPGHPEEDPGFLYTYTNHYILFLNEALTHLQFNQPEKAWQAITKAGTYVPDGASPRRMELLNHLVIISIARDDLEQSCRYFETAVTEGVALGSDLHQDEAHHIYQQMQSTWPHEKRIKNLAELLPR